ncbi:hypothetical protein PM082_023647 [Marasmius tenuissimus]|nr:hypothetical protein PM082_023647 [Marasmius tenuissimus]
MSSRFLSSQNNLQSAEVLPAIDRASVPPSPLDPYLTQKQYKEFTEFQQRHPGSRVLLPPPASIKFSTNNFTLALARSYLAAQLTPPDHTLPGSCAEFQEFGRQMSMAIDTSVPPIQHELNGNVLEVKRMVFASVVQWFKVWDKLPGGTDRRLLYKVLFPLFNLAHCDILFL